MNSEESIKDAEKFWEQNFAPYFANLSPKMDHFYWFCPKRPVETPLYTDLSDVFSKKLTYDCNVVLDNKVPGEKVELVSKTAAPQQFCQKNSPSWAKTAFVGFLVKTLPLLRRSALSSGELIVQCRTTNISELFWKK